MSEQLQQEFSLEDRQTLQRLLHRPLILPEDFKSWLYKFASSDAMPHFQELLGTRQRRWRVAEPAPDPVVCNSTAFIALAGGCELTALENGTYMVVFGFYTQSGGATTRYVRAEYNNQTAAPPASADCDIYIEGQAVMFDIVDLAKDNNNSIKMAYRVSGGTGADFRNRWLHAVQVAG